MERPDAALLEPSGLPLPVAALVPSGRVRALACRLLRGPASVLRRRPGDGGDGDVPTSPGGDFLRRLGRRAFRGHFVLWALIASLLCVSAFLAVYFVADSRYETMVRAESALGNIARTLSRDIGRTVALYDLSVRETRASLALPGIATLDPTTRQAAMFGMMTVSEHLDAVFVLDRSGKVRFESRRPEATGGDFSDRDYFRRLVDEPVDRPYISRPVVSRLTGRFSVAFARPILSPSGGFDGVVAAVMDLAYFQDLFRQLDMGSQGVVALYRLDGTLVARWPALPAVLEAGPPRVNFIASLLVGDSGSGDIVSPVDGVRRIFAYRRIPDTALVVVAAFGREDVFAFWRRKAQGFILFVALLGFLAAALALALRAEFVRRAFAESRLRSANGALEARVAEAVAERERVLVRAGTAERMQALGQLAGGVAHDMNNVLQGVSSCASLIAARAGDPAACRRLATMMSEGAERGSSITRRLLAFSRKEDLRTQRVPVRPLLDGMAEILSHSLGAPIAVSVVADGEVAPVWADKGQLETVILNLATNARDAMPGGGRLILSAADAVVGGDDPRLDPGSYVEIRVADDGCGIDPAVLSRVGEPFFTTKPPGHGTGLGLSMAKSFVDQSGGALSISSRFGQGTVVSVWLPQAGASSDSSADGFTASRRGGDDGAMPRRVLIVDDDVMVRDSVAELLGEHFDVVCAGDAAEALSIIDRDPFVDVLVTDLNMPRMDGLALIQEAQMRHPGLASILLTGHGVEAFESSEGARSYLLVQKPVTTLQLVAAVGRVRGELPV